MSAPGSSGPDLVGAYADLLRRVHRATVEHLDAEPILEQPPASPAELDQHASHLPAEVRALYQVSGGVRAFGHWFPALEHLAPLHASISDLMQDYQHPDLRDLLWGPAPEGETLTISATQGVSLFLETSGDHVGWLTSHDMTIDSGYRYVGPSLEAMFDAWATVAEAGFILLDAGKTVQADGAAVDAIKDLLHDHPCSPAAVSLFDPRP